VGAWCLFRQRTAGPFGEKEARFVRAVAPHVANGMRAAAAIEVARQGSRAEGVPSAPGVVVVDARRRITLRGGPATVQLEDLADVGTAGGELMPYAVASVLAGLARDSNSMGPRPQHREVRAQGRSGHWYLLRAMRAEPDAAGDAPTVIVIEPTSPRDPAVPLEQMYDLSQRQREVLLLVLRGESTKSIAARLGLSPHTIQDHLGVACEKVGVRGRKALLAKIISEAALPLPP
jgi:DNA-binding CsgD family transcriptional regulator